MLVFRSKREMKGWTHPSSRIALKGSERRVRGEVPGRFRPNAPRPNKSYGGGPRLRRSRVRDEALGLQQMGLLLATRTGPLVRAARQTQAPGGGLVLAHTRTTSNTPPSRPSDEEGLVAFPACSRGIDETGTFKEVLVSSDDGEDRSPRGCETLWLKRWIDRSRCERAPARSASGRCSSTRSRRVAHCAPARWTKIACSRSRSPRRIPRLTPRSGLRATRDRPTPRGAIREPS